METKDIPETVNWLLDFANLGCIPGELNPGRFKSYHIHTYREYITNEHIPILNRPPIELLPPPPGKKEDTFYKLPPDRQREKLEEEIKNLKPSEVISHSLPLHEQINLFKKINSKNQITHDGYTISIKSSTREPVFHGKNIELFPLIAEFCSNKGILLEKDCDHVFTHRNCNYSMAMTYWYCAQSIFNRVMLENEGENVHPFVKTAFDYMVVNTPSHELSKMVDSRGLEFWNDYRALHSLLRQCQCCGKFWISENKKGRKRKIYCSKKCNDVFNSQSRLIDNKSKKEDRAAKRDNTRAIIIEWLTENHWQQNEGGKFRFITKGKAQEIYNNLPEKAKTSVKDFNKNWARPRGYKV